MKIIAIGDVHHHVKAAESIASRYEDTHKIIFTGDYFDDFGDNAEVSLITAKWLKESLKKPNRIHILGNHDMAYNTLCETVDNGRVKKYYMCSGYSIEKDMMISEILGNHEWEKMKLHHFENGWHFTHAGMHPEYFEHPVLGMTNESILMEAEKIHSDYTNLIFNYTIAAAGRCRGGFNPVGGIIWHDHNRESSPVRKVFQVYGHTPQRKIDKIIENGGKNIDIDCGLCQVLEIDEDGIFNCIDTGFDDYKLGENNKNNLWSS